MKPLIANILVSILVLTADMLPVNNAAYAQTADQGRPASALINMQVGSVQQPVASVPARPPVNTDVYGSRGLLAKYGSSKSLADALMHNGAQGDGSGVDYNPVGAIDGSAPFAESLDLNAAAMRDIGTSNVLRYLANNSQGLRLSGEVGASEWPVYLTEAQIRAPLTFQLGYLSAVSVMPEASVLTIQMNDITIGQAHIEAPHGTKIIRFEVPRDVVQSGFNSLRIAVQQRHRVDCSIEATYELWTQIDSSQTGFLMAAKDLGVSSVMDLAAVSPNINGAVPIRAILPPQTDLASINRTLKAVQMTALAGRFEQSIVDVGATGAEGAGLNVAVGMYMTLRPMPGFEAMRLPAGPSIDLIPANGQGRPTVVVTGGTPEEVDEALVRFGSALKLKGSEAGIRAANAFPGYRIEGGQHVKMRDLGLVSQEFSGRLFRAAFNIIMPADFYPADYAKISLDMAGGYAAGLKRESQIVVSINGRIAVGSQLPKSRGDVFRELSVPMPLGMLRPGMNRVDIEAHVPTDADSACDPLTALSGKKRFLFLDDTEIVMPSIARIARMPDLAVTATGGFPYSAAGAKPHLFIPVPDRDSIGAAATLVTRMAISAGHPIDFQMTVTPPAVDDGSTLVVGVSSSLQPATFSLTGLDQDETRKMWVGRNNQVESLPPVLSRFQAQTQARLALQRNHPPECRMRTTPAKLAAASAKAAMARPELRNLPAFQTEPTVQRSTASGGPVKPVPRPSLYDEWNTNVRGSGWGLSFKFTLFDGLGDWMADKWSAVSFGTIKNAFSSKKDDPNARIFTPFADIAVSQRNHGVNGNGIWTLVTAPTPTILAESVACLVDPRVWNQISGQLATLDPGEAKIGALAASDVRFVKTQPLSLGNSRLIAAGWFSNNRYIYAGLMLLMATVLGLSTFWFVRNVGRQHS